MLHNTGTYGPNDVPVNHSTPVNMSQIGGHINMPHNINNLSKGAQQGVQTSSGHYNLPDYGGYNHPPLNMSSQIGHIPSYHHIGLQHHYMTQNSSSVNDMAWQNGMLPMNLNVQPDHGINMMNYHNNYEKRLTETTHNDFKETTIRKVPLNIPQLPVKSSNKHISQDDYPYNDPFKFPNHNLDLSVKTAEKLQMDSTRRKNIENTVRLIENILINSTKSKEEQSNMDSKGGYGNMDTKVGSTSNLSNIYKDKTSSTDRSSIYSNNIPASQTTNVYDSDVEHTSNIFSKSAYDISHGYGKPVQSSKTSNNYDQKTASNMESLDIYGKVAPINETPHIYNPKPTSGHETTIMYGTKSGTTPKYPATEPSNIPPSKTIPALIPSSFYNAKSNTSHSSNIYGHNTSSTETTKPYNSKPVSDTNYDSKTTASDTLSIYNKSVPTTDSPLSIYSKSTMESLKTQSTEGIDAFEASDNYNTKATIVSMTDTENDAKKTVATLIKTNELNNSKLSIIANKNTLKDTPETTVNVIKSSDDACTNSDSTEVPLSSDINENKTNTDVENNDESKLSSNEETSEPENELKYTQIKIEKEDSDSDANDIESKIEIKVEATSFIDMDYFQPFLRDPNGTQRDNVDQKIVDGENSVEEAIAVIKNDASINGFYECPHCTLLFQNPKRFLIHTKWHSFGLTYEKRTELAKEREQRKQEKREAKVIERMNAMEVTDVPVTGKVFPCKDCDKVFSAKGSLKNHRQRTHPTRSRDCKICKKTVVGWNAMRAHMATHTCADSTGFQCALCPKRFKYSHSLAKHKDTHLEKTHGCAECPKKFGSQALLKMHMKTHERVLRGTTFRCTYCGKGFYECYSLQVHERTHRNERPFTCDICNTSYGTNSSLKRHKKVSHNSSKPYECSVCHRFFATNRIRDSHEMRVHSQPEDFKFPCKLCECKYLKLKDLQKHVYKVHPKNKCRKKARSDSE